ncbi:phosphotransferase family protein [Emcibacter sp. SYSU 3D8]|uniref:phosphotransferase family protein n=1 Tax=Emcibacter sp. SYSU 3D8 TaxID=3133969 RepID=UPI0031FEC81B
MSDDRAILAQLLSAIRRDLGTAIMPDLRLGEARLKAGMMHDMLGHMVAWMREDFDPAAGERARFQGHFDDAERDAADAAERLAALEVEVTADRLQRFLRERMTGWADAVVESVVPANGGYSKDTILFRAVRPDGLCLDGVIRRDLPFGPGENSAVDEFPLLGALFRCGLPIAEPLWCEADKDWLGQPFIVTRRVAGEANTAVWDRDETLRRSVCLQLAALLAALHSTDPADIGLAGERIPADEIADYVALWHDRWQRHRVHDSPVLDAAFRWLADNVPQDLTRLSLIHADVGFHNILTDDGRITALLDWEFSHLGDPAEDLGYCRQRVEPLMPWDEFLAAYYAAGGAPYRESGARFYEVWRGVRNAVCCAVAWNGFLNDWYPALKMGYQGVPLYRMFILDVADRLERATS